MPKVDQGVETSLKHKRYISIVRTLCFVRRRPNEVLLLHGAPTKRIWPNRYNGIGGHVERGEDILTSVAREVREETGLTVRNIALRGVINVDADDEVGIVVFVFSAQYVAGEPVASEEGAPKWVSRDRLAALDLVDDLPELIPRILDATPDTPLFFARTHYDVDGRMVIEFHE